MYKNKTVPAKPEQITGVIENIEKSELKKADYLGNSDYYVISIKLEGNDKIYDYSIPERESFEFKVGEEVFFRSTTFKDKNKVSHKSFGKKFKAESSFELSSDLLAKLKDRDDRIDRKVNSNKIKP